MAWVGVLQVRSVVQSLHLSGPSVQGTSPTRRSPPWHQPVLGRVALQA